MRPKQPASFERCLSLLLIAATLASCRSSPPKHFYVLDAIPPQRASNAGPRGPVQVAAVNIPPSLDRQEMVRERAGASLEISDLNRWGAPLADMTQTVLTRDLMERLPAGKVIPPRTAAPAGVYEITLDLLQFGGDATGTVVIEGGWSMYRLGSDTPLLNRNVRFSEKAGAGDYATQARLMSGLLGRVADDIVSSLPRRNHD